jgi:hypothetical protein
MPDYLKGFVKDPSAVLDYTWNWAAWLGSDTITGTPTITTQSGLTKDSQSNTTTTVTAWLSGGTAGTTYTVACRIVTTAGRTDERTIQIAVRDR